jgi:hypothetical protein
LRDKSLIKSGALGIEGNVPDQDGFPVLEQDRSKEQGGDGPSKWKPLTYGGRGLTVVTNRDLVLVVMFRVFLFNKRRGYQHTATPGESIFELPIHRARSFLIQES